MGKRPTKSDILARRGETFVKLCTEEMGCVYTPASEKTPSIDGQIQLFDTNSQSNLYVNVQVKTGPSHIQRPNRRRTKHLYVLLDPEEVLDWQASNIPVILIWVNDDADNRYALWGDCRLGKRGARKLKLSTKAMFGPAALPKLLEIARTHAGRPTIPLLSTPILFPARVSEVRDKAWDFYSVWRKDGSLSPIFGKVKVTLRAWRHVTRVSSPQRAVIHKLALLPCAKEVIETATEPQFLRYIPDPSGGRELHALRGLYRSPYQADVMVEVIVEVRKIGRRTSTARLYALHEKRYWK